MVRILSTIIDFILPPRCPVTGEIVADAGMLSAQAWKELNFITAPYCQQCGVPFDFEVDFSIDEKAICSDCQKHPPNYEMARSAMIYDDGSRDLVLGFKHADQTQIVSSFNGFLERAAKDFISQVDLIIPVPLHPFRLLKRRYNQSALIAQSFAKHSQVPFCLDILVRTRSTTPQGHLAPHERGQNIKNAFAANPRRGALVKDKAIILIDDVYTTGSTVRECTRVLKQAGAKAVCILTLARAVKHRA